MFAHQTTANTDKSCATPAAVAGQGLVLQRKLEIGAVNDPLEHEADAVADKVMRMPVALFVQRKCAKCEEEDKALQKKEIAGTPEMFLVQRKCTACEEEDKKTLLKKEVAVNGYESAKSEAPPIVHEVLSSPSQPLDIKTQTFMESSFGQDFSSVHVHTDGKAAESAQAVNAQAYTVGHDVVFGAGRYAPNDSFGKRLIAHELTHVVQQQPRSFSASHTIFPNNSRSKLEAAQAALFIASGQSLPSVTPAPGAVHRQPAGAAAPAFRDCTPARTGQATSSQADIDSRIERARDEAHTWTGNAVAVLTAIQGGTATPAQQATLQAHFGILTATQRGTLRRHFITMRSRLTKTSLIICNSPGSHYCRSPRSWCAYTVCPTSGGYTHLCPLWFQLPGTCAEPDRASSMVHEAARAVGACGTDVQPGASYPPANSLTNVYSYSGFARSVSISTGGTMSGPTLPPPADQRHQFPNLVTGPGGVVEEMEGRFQERVRQRILESAEELP
jgi:hypothetical protein